MPRLPAACAVVVAMTLVPSARPVVAGWSSTIVMMTTVGDMDGDGTSDVVVSTVTVADGTSTVLSVRRGRDGRELWRVAADAWLQPFAGRVGSPGAPGLFVVGSDVDWQEAGPTDSTRTVFIDGTSSVTAYSRAGAALWSTSARSFGADFAVTVAGGAAFSSFVTVYDALPGTADDALFALSSGAGTSAGGAASTSAYLVSGADGSVTAIPAAAASHYEVVGVPDLSGDGLGDVVTSSEADLTGATLTAYRSVGGVPLWVSKVQAPFEAHPVPVGDATGDGLVELAVPVWTDTDTAVAVLSGATGGTLWQRPGIAGFALGDVTGDGQDEIGVISGLADDHQAGYRVTAYDSTGRELYHHVEGLPSGSDDRVSAGWSLADVQGDGVTDVVFAAARPQGARTVRRDGVVDGRTGRVLHRVPLGEGVGAPVDGRGDDFVEVSTQGTQLVLTARAGATGRLLWRTTVAMAMPRAARFRSVQLSAARLTADRCADVVVTLDEGDTRRIVVLGGRDGRVAWGVQGPGAPPWSAGVRSTPAGTAC